MGHNAVEKYLLSAPVRSLNLPALIRPSEYELFCREADLGWEKERGVSELIGLLKFAGVLVLFAPEWEEQDYGNRKN